MKLGYARVSTQEQNLEMQIQALEKAGCEKIYSETVSSVHPYKEKLEELLDFAREGDALVIWKLDRIGRNVKDLIEFSEKLRKSNINLISLTENLNTDSPTGTMYFQMIAMFAEFERNNLRERTRAGLEAAKERGAKVGRPNGLTEIQIKEMIKLSSGGTTAKELSQVFNVSLATIYRTFEKLKNDQS